MQRPMQENEEMTRFVLAMSNPQWVGDLLNCHKWNPLQVWRHFQPGHRYLPALSNHQIGNLRDGCKPSQPEAAKPDLWDYGAFYEPTQGCQKCDSLWGCWMDSVHSLRLQFILHALLSSEGLWSLPFCYWVR